MFGMLSVFSEFEGSMIRDRVMAGLDRARSSGKRLGRPRMAPFKMDRIRAALAARLLKISAAKVSEVRRMSAAARTGSSAIIRQAPGQATDGAVQDRSHPRCAGGTAAEDIRR